MAQLNSRGTLTRDRWDYFEHSNGVSSVFGTVPSGQIGCYFTNNSTGATAIDIYAINWSASVAGVFGLGFFLPPLVLTPITPLGQFIFPLQPDAAAPPGVNGMFSAFASQYITLVRYSAPTSGAQLAPLVGSYFATLPPGWTFAVSGPGSPNPCELSMTVWYQYVLDNVPPAV